MNDTGMIARLGTQAEQASCLEKGKDGVPRPVQTGPMRLERMDGIPVRIGISQTQVTVVVPAELLAEQQRIEGINERIRRTGRLS